MYITLWRDDKYLNKKKRHFILRLQQRYRKTINSNDYFRINSMLRTMKPSYNSVGGRISLYVLPVLGVNVHIIYDELKGIARTCYPPDPGESWQEIVNRYDSFKWGPCHFAK